MTSSWTDFYYKFPVSGLIVGIGGFAVIAPLLGLTTANILANCLGLPLDVNGAVTSTPIWYGQQGSAAISTSYVDPHSGNTIIVAIPAKGDPMYYYVGIRAWVPATAVLFNGTSYGWVLCAKSEAEQVLGVWQGTVP